jgi:iron complex outermembrane receptor protein
MITRKHLLLAGSVMAIATPVWAQSTQAPASDDVLTEVVVTAQRREERLSTLPIAASALGAEELSKRGVSNVQDLKSQVPSVSIQDSGFLPFVNIRGVGIQVANPSTSSGVAFYTDGFFIPHETAIGDAYFDLSRVEVLRGPQGTLVGQNSTGGAMFVVSKKPTTDEINGYVEHTQGNFALSRTEAAVNLPFNDQLAFRLAVHQDSRDSYYTNISSGAGAGIEKRPFQPGNTRGSGVRISTLWKPNEDVTVNLKFEQETRASDGIAAKSFAELYGPTVTNPRLRDPYTIDWNTPTKNDYDLWRVVNEVNWTLSDTVTLRSLTGYQFQKSALAYDSDYTDSATLAGEHRFYERTWQQELNLLSSNDGPLNWVVGAFVMRDILPVRLSLFNGGVNIDGHPIQTSIAGFGQITYKVNDKFDIVAGGRVTNDKKTSSGYVNIFGNSFGLDGVEEKSTKPTGKVALNFHPDPNSTLYVSASRGYKSGGINDADPVHPTFDPETINAYEGGFKTTLLDRHLRLALAGFYYDYQDFQLPVYDAATTGSPITNAGSAKIYGAEIELQGKWGPLGMNFASGYTHSEIGSLTLLDTRNGQTVDATGRPVNFAPKWTVSGGIDYSFRLSNGDLTARAQYAYTAKQYSGVFHLEPYDLIPSYDTVDLSLRYVHNTGVYGEVFGRNLADNTYVTGSFGSDAVMFGAPRTYGVKLGYNF